MLEIIEAIEKIRRAGDWSHNELGILVRCNGTTIRHFIEGGTVTKHSIGILAGVVAVLQTYSDDFKAGKELTELQEEWLQEQFNRATDDLNAQRLITIQETAQLYTSAAKENSQLRIITGLGLLESIWDVDCSRVAASNRVVTDCKQGMKNVECERVCDYLPLMWGLRQDRILDLIFKPDGCILENQQSSVWEKIKAVCQYIETVKGPKFHVNQRLGLHILYGLLTKWLTTNYQHHYTHGETEAPPQEQFIERGAKINELILHNNVETAEDWCNMLKNTDMLNLECWVWRTYTGDEPTTKSMRLNVKEYPKNKRTVTEILHRLDDPQQYSAAYVYYLITVIQGLMRSRIDPTFDGRKQELVSILQKKSSGVQENLALKRKIEQFLK